MQTNNAVIIAIGNELISGNTQDTNSQFLASSLKDLGVIVRKIVIVGDELSDILQAVQHASQISKFVITCGGLGPTSDDITRDAISKATNQELTLNELALAKLKLHCQRRKRELTNTNKRQAFFPQNAVIVQNPVGTAEAFVTTLRHSANHEVKIFSLPGVPRELKAIVSNSLKAVVKEVYQELPNFYSSSFRVFGVSEAHVGQVIESLDLQSNIIIAYRPHFPFVTVNISMSNILGSATEVETARESAISAIGNDFVFAANEQESLSETVGKLLSKSGLTLSTAESCTGGLVAHQIVSTPGASKYFTGSIVCYSNEVKRDALMVSQESLQQFGAVSKEVAIQMAAGAREKLGSDLAVSITGIAGPDGASEQKPVGTVWFGISSKEQTLAVSIVYPAERNSFRYYASAMALDLVRRFILKLPLTWESK